MFRFKFGFSKNSIGKVLRADRNLAEVEWRKPRNLFVFVSEEREDGDRGEREGEVYYESIKREPKIRVLATREVWRRYTVRHHAIELLRVSSRLESVATIELLSAHSTN
jgi:hypothetical protein